MKRKLLASLLCLTALVTINNQSSAQSTLVYYWNFNSYTPLYTAATSGTAVYADVSPDYGVTGTDTTKVRWIEKTIAGVSSSYASYCDVVAGDASDTLNLRLSAPSGNAIRPRNPNDSLEILMYMPTTGYKNLQIKYANQLSSYTSGDSINVFSYSVDSGTTWITSGAGLSEWADSGSYPNFRLISVHVNDTLANNNRKFVFRVNLVGRNTGTSGNNRIDNVTLDGDPIPSLGVEQVATANAYSVYPNPVNETLNITGSYSGEKTVTITNVLGQTVISSNVTGTNCSFNTSALVSGIYYMAIRQNATGALTIMKFVKQ